MFTSIVVLTLVVLVVVMAVIVSVLEGVLKARTPFIIALFFFAIWGICIFILGAPIPNGTIVDTSWCFGIPTGLTVLSSIVINKIK